jgi:hypothetical protein
LGGGADFVTMCLDDVRACPTLGGASEITDESNRRALWRAVPFGTPQLFVADER